MPKVSVIVPVYRAENYLERCVGSILGQSYRDFELLLIDDGSPDGCGILCDGYAARDSRVRVIHQENRGVSAARNAGLTAASGKFAAFCDADDFWMEDHLSRLVAAAEESGADMVSCNHAVLDSRGTILRRTDYLQGIRDLTGEAETLDYILNAVLGYKTGWEIWSRLFDLALIREKGIRFPEDCGYGEDLAFILQVCLHSRRVQGIGFCGYCYCQNAGSVTARADARPMLDALNTAAKAVERAYRETMTDSALFPLVHHRMLRGEYGKVPASQIPAAIEKIRDREWYFAKVRGLLGLRESLAETLGKRAAGEAIALCRFCLHGNVLRFRIEKNINRILHSC